MIDIGLKENCDLKVKRMELKAAEKDIKIAFSSKYMLDAIKSFNCDQVELMFNGEIKPIIIKNAEDDKLTQLILPIRTY